jgi:monoamine oxidase
MEEDQIESALQGFNDLHSVGRIGTAVDVADAGAMTSYRVDGGMMRLVNTLADKVDAQSIHASLPIDDMVKQGDASWVLSGKKDGENESVKAAHVVLSAPPRVLLQNIGLAQYLPATLSQKLLATPTWMAAQAKFVAIYQRPFWREEGLSGDAFSRVGPMVELHDASTDGASDTDSIYALFDFVGVPSSVRNQRESGVLEQHCLNQLVDIFGESAAQPLHYYLKDWAQDPWVATEQDKVEAPSHPHIAISACQSQLDALSLSFVGAEYAQSEAGYLEGALMSAQSVVEPIMKRLKAIF